ncbi:DsbA family protein [Deinococcus sp. KNUC1210]|uniref:DsbA family protein n=1 Tax=Deinococcus sp. KNUC1210 TaxID=2917691 RepID=UPI001EF045AD|nr:thioredoxin domain-containing protein [Deinococcus sp. KNUC1210]ULH15444.1 DsbA family protein [Deinococcus sp. KNUC1210]
MRSRPHFLMLSTLLTSSALLSLASAQVGGSVAATLTQPALSSFKVGGMVLTDASGATVTLTPKGTYVASADIRLPTADLVQAGQLLNALTGQDFAQGLSDFLKRPDVQAKLPDGLTVTAEAFDLKLQQQADKALTLNVSLHQLTGFGAVPSSRILGDVSAPIVVRMYSDLQCPYCQKAELETLPTVLKNLKTQKDVRFEFHQFPLESIHPNARPAAEAAACVEKQGKFWAFKDALFRRSDWQSMGNPSVIFQAVAVSVGVKLQPYRNCIADRSGKQSVDEGVAEATRLGVNATPSVYVNGYRVANPYDPASYQALIDFVRAK